MTPSREQGWFTRERMLALVLFILTALGVYVCYLIAKPFIAAIAFALALAVATGRPYEWLRQRLPNDSVSAAVAVVLVTILIVGPAALIGTYIVQQVSDSVAFLKEGDALTKLRQALEQAPHIGGPFRSLEATFDLQGQISRIGGWIAEHAATLLRGSVQVVTQLAIMLFVLFFMYRDRSHALSSILKLVPLSRAEADSIFRRIDHTIRATVNGSLTVAAVQASLAGLMYWILGVPVPLLWASATFFAALLPVFGTALIWVPITLFLLGTGSFVKAAVLAGWGALAVGTIDNILYPLLVGDKLRLHTVPTFFSIVGGISLFGPAGLILGPLALAITVALLDVWWERTLDGQAAEDNVTIGIETQEPPGSAVQTRGAGD